MKRRGDDDFNDNHRVLITAALDVLNEFGRPAAEYLADELSKEENSDAEAWIAAYFEPSYRETMN